MAPRRRIRRQASSPSANVANPKARRPSPGGPGVEAQAGRGDDPEGALGADEQLGQVRAGGRPGAAPVGADDAAVGQRDLEADHHVLDLPVAGRVLAGPPAGQPAADGREVHRLGPVPEGVARAAAARAASRSGPKVPGRDVGQERGLVDVDRARQRGQVEGDAAEDGDRPAAHPAAPGDRGDRRPGLVAGGQDGGHLGGVVGRTTSGRPGRHLAPRAAQPMASGHQSRPASARSVVQVRAGTAAPVAARRSARSTGHLAARARPGGR